MTLVRWTRLLAFVLLLCPASLRAGLKIVSPDGYLPGIPFPVRIQAQTESGSVDRQLWEAEVSLSASPGVFLSTNHVRLRNGLGTALLTILGETNFTLRADLGQLTASRPVLYRGNLPRTHLQGSLTGSNTTWTGIVQLTGSVTVPSGHTLTIDPGTIVLIDGAASGNSAAGLIVNGSVQSLGTEAAPIVITASDPSLNWGQILHQDSSSSLYRYTFLSKAGRARAEGHTGTGPAFRLINSGLTLEHSIVSDLDAGGTSIGKVMMATGSDLKIDHCVFARARMGPEIASTGLLCTNSFFLDMTGPDDADGIYLHDAGTRSLVLSGCVFARGDDDAIDTLNSRVLVENCILRDWSNPAEDAKALSGFHGDVTLRQSLIVNCFVGAATKSSGPLAVLRLDQCTIFALDKGVSAATKSNASAGNISIFLTNCVIRASDSLHSDFDSAKFVAVQYCNLGEPWPGPGNTTVDPQLVDVAKGDFRPLPGASVIDSGHPASPPDGLPSRSDVGFYTGQTLGGIVISEIMYHPASENPLEEYIEILNSGRNSISLNGWRLSDGVIYTFPDVTLAGGEHLVIAANLNVFTNKYPAVTNVVGNWTGSLSNSREDIDLDNAAGIRVDSVRYADEGDWARRTRGPFDRSYRGWEWFAEHDGLGRSLELVNPNVSNNHGQNWAASVVAEGTPGRLNSVFRIDTAPVIEILSHSPLVPKSSDSVRITARITGLAAQGTSAALNWRIDATSPAPFTMVPMRDDGIEGDSLPGDLVFTAVIPPQTNDTVVEFFVTISDIDGRSRSWPAPVIETIPGSPTGQLANALYQVDDSEYTGTQPLYKIIMPESERLTLQAIGDNVNGGAGSDAQMNATFISIDGTSTQLRYLAGIRNRGHGTRTAKPNNFRVNFRSDDTWKNVLALNLNAQFTYLQVLGSVLHLKSGSIGAHSRAIQLRVNNANLIFSGGIQRTYGSYAANEAINADWAERQFPNDGEGNVYRALRDLFPPEFDYRTETVYRFLSGGENKNSYTNTWYKSTNESEDDWTDLISMLRVMGPNGTEPFTSENVRRVINPEQWLRHLAIMNLLGNSETGLNSGYNDDYFMYRGLADPRFVLMYYDLDQILGFNNSYSPTGSLFTAANDQGAGRALGRFLNHAAFLPIYYETLRELLQTSFSAVEFNSTVDQVLGDFVPETIRNQIKSWMDARRNFVLGQLPPAPASPLRVTLRGIPRSPTPRSDATFRISGENVTHYRYSLNGGQLSAEFEIATPISLSDLPAGTNNLAVIGRSESGDYSPLTEANIASWVIDPATPPIRLNELIASRSGGGPDQIELYNEGSAAYDLSVLRLSDDRRNPSRFALSGALAPGAYLVLDSTQLGFSLDASGESIFLFNKSSDVPIDSVEFGHQIPDLSIGRVGPVGEWLLGSPTFGSANLPHLVGNPERVRINEWLTAGVSPFPDDFIELFNPEPLPVDIGGSFLSNQRAGDPTRSAISPLTFVSSRSFLTFHSGNGNSADEFAFDLSPDQGEITLFAKDLAVIDSVVYGPQRLGLSTGRCPDGAPAQKQLVAPTPGAANQCPSEPVPPQRLTILPFDHSWRYDRSGADLDTAWRQPAFNDAQWPSGPALIGFESDSLPQPLRTQFQNPRVTTYYFRTTLQFDPTLKASSIEVTHLVDDGAAFYLNGQEIGQRYNLSPNAAARSFALSTTEASAQSFTIAPSLLLPGENVLAVEVHQVNSTSGDMVFGLRVDALVITNNAAAAGVVLNEVLARNASFKNNAGRTPGFIELHNPSTNAVDLAGMSLSDELTNPSKWVFPSGSLLGGQAFLVIECDNDAAPSSTNTGFSLRNNGGSLYLFDAADRGAALLSSINFGLQASDWSIGRVPDGSGDWILNIPTPAARNRSTTLGNPALLKINEWLANPASGDDWFELFNPEPEPVSLAGLGLSDTLDSVKDRLPALSFLGVGAHGFLKIDADGNTPSGPNHVSFSLSAAGETIALTDPRGAVIDAIAFGPQNRGTSEGRLPDGGVARHFFPFSNSPGAANFLPLSELLINEVLTHTDAPLEDAIELYNPGSVPLDISGWFLSDSPVNLRKYQVPTNTVVPARGYVVFYEYQFNGDEASDPFAFSSGAGEQLFLSQSTNSLLTGLRASAQFGAARNGVSFGRVDTSQGPHFVQLSSRTFGVDQPTTLAEFRTGRGAVNSPPVAGPVVITEINYNPPGADHPFEFIELRNITAASTALFDPLHPTNTWRVRGAVELDLPAAITLAPGEFLLLAGFDPINDTNSIAQFRGAFPQFTARLVGPFSGNLNNSGESIQLEAPDSPDALLTSVPYITVDQVDYTAAAPWPVLADASGQSLQKSLDLNFGNEPRHWTAAAPTPGTPLFTDRDGDLLPDAWEQQFALDPDNRADAGLDADSDGLSNFQEFLAGTDPRNPASTLALNVQRDGNQLEVDLFVLANRVYELLATDSLDRPWQVVAEIPAGAARTETRRFAFQASASYFRARVRVP